MIGVVARLVVVRLVAALALVAALTLLTYVVFATIPVDPAGFAVPRGTPPEERELVRRQLGLDRPVLEQWGTFARDLGTRADLGTTLPLGGRDAEPVTAILGRTLPATLTLVIGGFLLTLAVAIPAAMVAARRRGSAFDRAVLGLCVVGVVLHPFVVGILLKEIFAARLGILPPRAYCPATGIGVTFNEQGNQLLCGGLRDWLHHAILPCLTFALFFIPLYTRVIRSRLLAALAAPHVLVARAKGASEHRILTRHVGRNAVGPTVALLAIDLGTILIASIYVETVFGLNGVGLLVAQNLTGANGYDRNIIVGVVVLMAMTITAAGLAADLINRVLHTESREP